MIVIIGQTKLFSPAYLLILFKVQLSSEYVLKQEFKLKYALNYVIFIKKSPSAEGSAPRSPMLPAPPDPHLITNSSMRAKL